MMVSNARKMYVEMPFPPKGMIMPPGGKEARLSFKKTGKQEKIAGYSCDGYTGTGTMGENQMVVDGCFSTSAPGAANFTAFQQTMSEKVKGTPMALMTDTPPGIPLKINTSLKQKTGARPAIVTHMVVSKVSEQDLPESTFVPPKDFTKQQMPIMGRMGPGMTGKPVPGAAPAPSPKKVPE
jgi:hypothetical protein